MRVSLYDSVRVRPYGERGYLLDCVDAETRIAIERATTLNPPEGFQECVLGAENVLVVFLQPVAKSVLVAWLRDVSVVLVEEQMRRVEVPVVYDGPDLTAVAVATGLSEAEVVAIHSAPEYRVRMMGFAPGFPYLDGLDPRLHLERKASPRYRIEPGSVAIGGSHAGIYSVASPGGWHLLGRTDLVLFQPDQAKGDTCEPRDVFALAAGDVVKFIVQ